MWALRRALGGAAARRGVLPRTATALAGVASAPSGAARVATGPSRAVAAAFAAIARGSAAGPARAPAACFSSAQTAPAEVAETSTDAIRLSDHAVERLRELQAETPDEPVYLRLMVEGGGCSGFQYEFSLDSVVKPGDKCVARPRRTPRLPCAPPRPADASASSDDASNARRREGGRRAGRKARRRPRPALDARRPPPSFPRACLYPRRVYEQDGAKVISDDLSLEFLRGSVVDFESDLMRSGFVVAENPNAASSCGCGSSFVAK